MISLQILCPMAWDGTCGEKYPQPDKIWGLVERILAEDWGGWTRLSDVSGGWRDSMGVVIEDSSRVYAIAVGDLLDPRVRGTVQELGRVLSQDAMCAMYLGHMSIVDVESRERRPLTE